LTPKPHQPTTKRSIQKQRVYRYRYIAIPNDHLKKKDVKKKQNDYYKPL